MKKDVLIIAHFTNDFDETGNNRFNYIADLLARNGWNVELVTSDFSHRKKIKKQKNPEAMNYNYKITTVHEPPYKKNLSLERFLSHHIIGKNLKKYLSKRNNPDIIYCAVPSLDIGKVAAKYASENKIRLIIDVQDLWPEAFRMVFKLPFISDLLFYPMRKTADYIYATADEIIAVSETYKTRVLQANNNSAQGYSIFLGTELDTFDQITANLNYKDKPEGEIWLTYIGTLGHCYDLMTVMDALELIKNQGIDNLKFNVVGEGPLRSKFEKYAKEKGLSVSFTGRLPYNQMARILRLSDIAVNPITKGAAGSVINKVADYAAAGLPVLNTQECQEYRILLENYQAGLNCLNSNVQDLSEKLLVLYKDEALRKQMAKNSRKLAEEKFDRKKTYKQILDIIEMNYAGEGADQQ